MEERANIFGQNEIFVILIFSYSYTISLPNTYVSLLKKERKEIN